MHLLIEAQDGEPDLLFGSHTVYESFLLDLTAKAGMTPISDPLIRDTDTGRMGFIILAESHVSIHAIRQSNAAFIDLFSCKPLPCQTDEIEICVSQIFGFKSMDSMILDRGLETLKG